MHRWRETWLPAEEKEKEMAFVPALGAAISTLVVAAAAGVGFTTAYILAREVNESQPRCERR